MNLPSTSQIHHALTNATTLRLLEVAPFAHVVLNAEGEILAANQEAHRLFGYGSGELPGRLIARLFSTPFDFQEIARGFVKPLDDIPRDPRAPIRLDALRFDGTGFPTTVRLAFSTRPRASW
ncbi:MAG: PAS domain-containing protein [Thermoplasmatota archaeon]